MNCVICKTGQIAAGNAIVTLQRGETTIVIKNVPADVCDNCGEYYLSEEMAERVLELGESAVKKGVEVEVMRWAAQFQAGPDPGIWNWKEVYFFYYLFCCYHLEPLFFCGYFFKFL